MKLKSIITQNKLDGEGLEGIGFEFRDDSNATNRIAALFIGGSSPEQVASLLNRLAEGVRKGEFVVGQKRLTTKEINFDELTDAQKESHLRGLTI